MTRLIEMMRTMVENHNGWVLCSFCPDVVSQPTSGNPGLQVVLLSFGDEQITQMMKMTSQQVHILICTALTIEEG